MENLFFGALFRMKYINRWGLMRNSRTENLAEHCMHTAMITHMLCIIKNLYFNGNIDGNKLSLIALYHDVSEIFTGDLPTPIKYKNSTIETAYKQIEHEAAERLLGMLNEDLQAEYRKYIVPDLTDDEKNIIKSADKISALIKCMEEEKMGNDEFKKAYELIIDSIEQTNLPETEYFMKNILPVFNLNLDQLMD